MAYNGTNWLHLPKNSREGRKLVSNMTLKKWNTNFRLEDSVRKNRTALSDEFHCSRKFSAGMTQKGVYHLLFDQIFRRKLLVNDKQPLKIGNWRFRWNAHQWRRYSIWQWFHPFLPWVVPIGLRDNLKLAKPYENTEMVSSGKRGLPFQKFHVLQKEFSGRHKKLGVASTFQPASPVFWIGHSRWKVMFHLSTFTPRGKYVPWVCGYVPPRKGMVFGPFLLENGYTLCLFWSGIAYGFREKYVSVWTYCYRFNSKSIRKK